MLINSLFRKKMACVKTSCLLISTTGIADFRSSLTNQNLFYSIAVRIPRFLLVDLFQFSECNESTPRCSYVGMRKTARFTLPALKW
jgi:hypothetical protein